MYDLADPVTGSIDVWALDLASARPSRLTFNPSTDFYPVCSPSGDDVVFASLREGPPNLFRVSLAAPGSERSVRAIAGAEDCDGLVPRREAAGLHRDQSQDELGHRGCPSGRRTAAGGRWRPWPKRRNARLSPDGRWIAYNSNESGGFEIYVQPFPTTGAKWQVSKGGGQQPQWRRDGAELFYVTPDRKLIGVGVKTGSDFVLGEAHVLMDTRITGWPDRTMDLDYAASADGQRFLINTASDAVLPITLVLNWPAALGQTHAVTSPVIHVSGCRKTYGSTVAVDDVSFDVNDGEIFGLIGPNGAGKTTTMECVEGLRAPDRGTISVLGPRPGPRRLPLQERIGVQLQQAQLQKRIKVWEAVDLWASMYRRKAVDAERMLEQLG